MDAAAIDQLSSFLEANHQFLRQHLAENNCTDEFLPELHSSGVLDMMPEPRTLKSYSNFQRHSSNKLLFGQVFFLAQDG